MVTIKQQNARQNWAKPPAVWQQKHALHLVQILYKHRWATWNKRNQSESLSEYWAKRELADLFWLPPEALTTGDCFATETTTGAERPSPALETFATELAAAPSVLVAVASILRFFTTATTAGRAAFGREAPLLLLELLVLDEVLLTGLCVWARPRLVLKTCNSFFSCSRRRASTVHQKHNTRDAEPKTFRT